MKPRVFALLVARAWSALVLSLVWPVMACAQNGTIPGALSLRSTIHSVSVRASMSGDDNGNTSAVVEYRRVGTDLWLPASTPIIDRRVDVSAGDCLVPDRWFPNPGRDEARVSIVGLSPNTEYKVRVDWTDPDGRVQIEPVTGTVRTWPGSPDAWVDGRVLHVSSGATSGRGTSADPYSLQRGLQEARPGDTLKLSGRFSNFVVSISGRAEQLIKFEGPATVTGPAANSSLIVTGSYLWFQNLTFERSNLTTVSVRPQASNVWITDSTFNDAARQSRLTSAALGILGSHVFVLDNRFFKPNPHTVFANSPNAIFVGPVHTVVLARNIIDGHFLDGIGGGNDATRSASWVENVDVYENLLTRNNDGDGDAIEVEGININTRVWGNDIRSSWNQAFGISPVTVGPLYVFRNRVVGDFFSAVKVGNGGNGAAMIWHNSFDLRAPGARRQRYGFSGHGGLTERCTRNLTIQNNILVFDRSAFRSLHADALNHDHQLWHQTGRGVFAWLWVGAATTRRDFSSLRALQNLGSAEADSRAGVPQWTASTFSLGASSPAVDAAVSIPNFNDPSSAWPPLGRAPDIGAVELGSAVTASPGAGRRP